MAIGTVEFDLSLRDHETGEYLTARTYTVEGVNNVDGTPRQLSMGQLVMAICLQRATALENGYTDPATGTHVNGIIDLMEELNVTSSKLEALTEIEKTVVSWAEDYQNGTNTSRARSLNNARVSSDNDAYPNWTYKRVLVDMGVIDDSISYVNLSLTTAPDPDDINFSDFNSALESKMDENNSFSQQKMIQLQSQTSKRDQAYDMISNVLKSLNTVQVGIVNNM